jgi:hypothetical protein
LFGPRGLDNLIQAVAVDVDVDLHLGRMALDGSGSTILATMPASGGGSVAVDDACVYWGNALGIFSLAKSAAGPFAQQ